MFSSRVIDVFAPAPGVRVLRLEVPSGMPAFLPGQYVMLGAGGLPVRAFSIASGPAEPFIELHVRDTGHGLGAHPFAPGEEVTLEGPLGASVLQEGGGPLLAIAGGIGIAPMKSLLAAYLGKGGAEARLVWGVRGADQLYLDDYFRALEKEYAHFSYAPVVGGFVGDAVPEGLGPFSVYLAGPKGMIDAVVPVLLRRGAEKARIFSDAFSS